MEAATEYRLTALERAMGELSKSTEKIATSVEAIARLEERHVETREALGRAFRESNEIKRELSELRLRMENFAGKLGPLEETRRWMVAALLSVVGLVGTAVIGLVLIQR